ncbi:MAG: hypothetical protein KA149_02065 [Chitinophagales bacterium]|nr:hypothetical protein [Chitinophagales bacterium]
MKKISTLFAALTILTAANAKTYTLTSGKWTDAAAWGGEYAGATIKANDVVIITGQMTMNTSIVVEGTLQVEKGAGMVGMKDLMVAKNGTFVNNGNTVMKRIVNEGTINNNLIMEAMMDIDNKGQIDNNNNMVAGNNLSNYGGEAGGHGGAYFVNNNVSASASAKFGADVKVLYGNAIENAAASIASALNLNAIVKMNSVELSVSNPSKLDVSLFSIEKSTDGKNFTLVEMVSNISKSEVAMTYTDNSVNTSLTFYRVKAINANGTETILPVAAVKTI